METLNDNPVRVEIAIKAVRRAFDKVRQLFGGEPEFSGKRGGYFCLAELDTGQPMLILLIGEATPEKAERYRTLCQEKAKRLASHPEDDSSWESRQPEMDMWGGAVRGRHYIFSFSGFPERADEALVLHALRDCEPHYDSILNNVAAVSGNHYWRDMR